MGIANAPIPAANGAAGESAGRPKRFVPVAFLSRNAA